MTDVRCMTWRVAVASAAVAVAMLGGPTASAADAAVATAPLPASSFFRHADVSGARLSPSGRWVAIRSASASKRSFLAVVDVEGKSAPAIVANFGGADVRFFDWVNDDRLVFNLGNGQVALMDQTFGPGLYSVRRDGTEQRQLIKVRGGGGERSSFSGRQPLEPNHALLSIPRTGGDEVVVGDFHRDTRGEIDAVSPLRLNVVTLQATPLLFGGPANARQWWFDPKGEARAAQTLRNGQSEIWWRGPNEQAWRSLARFSSIDPAFEPEAVDGAGQLYVTAPAGPAGTTVLKRFDFAAGRPSEQSIVSTPGFDFQGSLVTDRAGEKVLGIRFSTDAQDAVWFDPAVATLQKLADAKFPGRINAIQANGAGTMLVVSYSDQDPGSFWIYRSATDSWQAIGSVRADLEPKAMATLDFHRIKARDGLDLPVWVTALPAAKGAPPRPAVVLVHGGPWVRGGEWGWHPGAQFLASRGYVVIEPEFRGSLGFGRQHFRSGWKHWGDTMQDDVADAVRWAAGKGLVDAGRVCIAGASYGGYATLMGLVAYPQLYRCGVAWVAVSDPRLLFDASWASDSNDESRFHLPELIGDPKADAAMLNRATPVERAAEIKAPLLLAFGRDDRRVPLEHGTRIREALRAVGREPEWIVYDGEGHGWQKPENNVDFWERVEKFLARHLVPAP